jgi:hypothetical protein
MSLSSICALWAFQFDSIHQEHRHRIPIIVIVVVVVVVVVVVIKFQNFYLFHPPYPV